jgi:hypothetical protein
MKLRVGGELIDAAKAGLNCFIPKAVEIPCGNYQLIYNLFIFKSPLVRTFLLGYNEI